MSFKKSALTIVSSDGTEQEVMGLVAGADFILIEDPKVILEVGYEIRRKLPNVRDEVFDVVDPVFYDVGFKGPHYQVKIRKKGTMEHRGGGNYYSAHGANARINVNSTDNSINTVADQSVFGDLRTAVHTSDIPADARAEIILHVDTMEKTAGKSREDYLQAFQNFTTASTKWAAVIGPYLPALVKWLS
jgi:hypothetical protein